MGAEELITKVREAKEAFMRQYAAARANAAHSELDDQAARIWAAAAVKMDAILEEAKA